MSTLSLFVVLACAALVLLVALLTLVTQLPEAALVVPWGWLRGARSGEQPGPRKPGKKARRTQRKRERLSSLRAAEEIPGVPEGTASSVSR